MNNLSSKRRRMLDVWQKRIPPTIYRTLVNIKRMLMVLKAYIVYRGNKYTCLMCGKKAKKYLPVGYDFPVLKELNVIGGMKIEEGECPFCFSHNRERLIYYYLENKTEIFKKKMKILHFAPERNIRSKLERLKTIDYVTADINLMWAKERVDVTNIHYADNTFDAVICNHVLEHVNDDRKAMKEIYRILKPGGWAIVQVPISTILEITLEDTSATTAEEREKRFGQYDHVRIYGKDYHTRLLATGAKVKIFNCLEMVGEEKAEKYGFIKEENIYVMEKSLCK